MNKGIVFIDRDGTINLDKGYVHKIQDFELIPESLEALQLLTRHHILIYIITNQAGIAKGYYTEKAFLQFTNEMIAFFQENRIKIEEVLYCPHHPEGVIVEYKKECSCRKPSPYLLKQALSNTAFSTQQTALIGDKNSDIEAGKSLGIRTYLVETGYGKEEKLDTRADFILPNLKEAVLHLIKSWKVI